MHARVRLVVIGVLACGFAALAGVWIAALTGGNEAAATGPLEGYHQPDEARVPDFALRNQDGDTVAPGKDWTIYAFVYSTCEDTCPIMTQQIRGALDKLGHDVPVYGISVDPANDTPPRAQKYLAEQFMTGRMQFALGSQAELQPVWDAFGIAPQRDGKEHSARVVVVDGDGKLVVGWPASRLTDDVLYRDLQRLGA